VPAAFRFCQLWHPLHHWARADADKAACLAYIVLIFVVHGTFAGYSYKKRQVRMPSKKKTSPIISVFVVTLLHGIAPPPPP
jgi:hypothetical protein